MLNVVLVQPEIPQNTGNVGRLCVAAGARLHLVEPLGYTIDEKRIRRSGMDYWERLDLRLWPSLPALREAHPEGRFWMMSSKAGGPYWNASFRDGDFLLLGRESKGLPASLLASDPDHCLTIPMTAGTRSVNLATATGIVLYEAVRQIALRGGAAGLPLAPAPPPGGTAAGLSEAS
jgi:tRNA (cytidine/uridine-2'-O-)-methyltransferase